MGRGGERCCSTRNTQMRQTFKEPPRSTAQFTQMSVFITRDPCYHAFAAVDTLDVRRQHPQFRKRHINCTFLNISKKKKNDVRTVARPSPSPQKGDVSHQDHEQHRRPEEDLHGLPHQGEVVRELAVEPELQRLLNVHTHTYTHTHGREMTSVIIRGDVMQHTR